MDRQSHKLRARAQTCYPRNSNGADTQAANRLVLTSTARPAASKPSRKPTGIPQCTSILWKASLFQPSTKALGLL